MIEQIVEEMRAILSPLVGDDVELWLVANDCYVSGEVYQVTATQVELRVKKYTKHVRLDQIQVVTRSTYGGVR
jgi:hypothetical protein